MDYIKVTRQDHREVVINLSTIVSFNDYGESTHISLMNQEYIDTEHPIADALKKQLALSGNRLIRVGE